MAYQVPKSHDRQRMSPLALLLIALVVVLSLDLALPLSIRVRTLPAFLGVYFEHRAPIYLALFSLSVVVLVAYGFDSWQRATARQAIHWTRDRELLFWRERNASLWQTGEISVLLHAVGTASHIVLLLVPAILLLTDPLAQHVGLLGLASLLPGIMLGIDLATWLLREGRLTAVALLDTGVIVIARFFPWSAFARFEADPATRTIRLYATPSAATELVAIRPPDERLFQQAHEILSARLAQLRPAEDMARETAQRQGKTLLWAMLLLSLVLSGAALGLALGLEERALACGALFFGALGWSLLLVRCIGHLVGSEVPGGSPGAGLTQLDDGPPSLSH